MMLVNLNLVFLCIFKVYSPTTALYRNSQSESFTRRISNMQQLLKPYEHRHCLIVITSLGRIDVGDQSIPVLLRKLDSVFTEEHETPSHRILFWDPENIDNTTTMEICTFFELQYRSQYFQYSLDYCTEIFLHRFASSTKPWNCELFVDILLPVNPHYPCRLGPVYPYALRYSTRAPLVARTFIQVKAEKEMQITDYQALCPNLTKKKVHISPKTELSSEYFTVFITSAERDETEITIEFVESFQNCGLKSKIPITIWDH